MRRFLDITKALSDESRVRALLALRDGELCVCQLIELLGSAPSTISKHMTVLEQAGLVECRKDGRWRFYRLPGLSAADTVKGAYEWLALSLGKSPQATEDRKRLKEILRRKKEDISECYKN
ncbi:TPA: transcriptional regulator [Candidatus Sumerlaeota bacterium]|jgi:ArsR family transcriptional regulator, arsenate/arsenite/antimonite-responsive transcriptional repressor|nr:transcriptional regulator [Candidatus Sumerlaeota bacterium]